MVCATLLFLFSTFFFLKMLNLFIYQSLIMWEPCTRLFPNVQVLVICLCYQTIKQILSTYGTKLTTLPNSIGEVLNLILSIHSFKYSLDARKKWAVGGKDILKSMSHRAYCLNHRWQTEGPRAKSALHLVLSRPAPCLYLTAAELSLHC